MFSIRRMAPVIALAALLAATVACGGPPESCGAGGTADEAAFAQYLSEVELVSGATGQPGEPGDEGPQFSDTDEIIMQVETLTDVSLRTCVESRSAGGQIPFDQTRPLTLGSNTFSIGSFNSGTYVVRVIIDNTLVVNLTFTIR